MAASNSNSFVPGGRRFTLITPYAPSGRPTTVLIPMLAPGYSTSDLSHLIKKRPHSSSPVPELRRVRRKGTPGPFTRRLNTPEDAAASIDSMFPLVDVIRSGGQIKAKLEEVPVISTRQTSPVGPRFIRKPEESPPNSTSVQTSSENIVEAKTRGRRRPLKRRGAATALLPRKNYIAHQPSLQLQSRKLYKNDGVMHWYVWRTDTPMGVPPQSCDATYLEPGTLFVNHVGAEEGHICQIWSVSNNDTWIPIEEGDRRVFSGEIFFLMVNAESGNPSWVNEATFNKKSRAIKRQGKMRAR